MTERATPGGGASVRLIRPPHQARADYVPFGPDSVHDRFQRRLEPENYTAAYFGSLRAELESALRSAPGDDRIAYELAFTLLQDTAGAADVARARELLAGVSVTTIDRPDDVAKLSHLAAGVGLPAPAADTDFVVERVNWSVNNHCPMVCRGCYNPFTARHLNYDEAVTIVDRLAAHGVRYLVISGGDPLLWEHLFGVVEYASSRHIDVAVDTTGYTLDEATLSRLGRHISSLRLPIDGSTNEIQRSFRRSGDPDLVGRLQHSLTLCDTAGFDRVRVHTVVSRQNLADLPALADAVLAHPSVAEWVLFQWWGRRAPQHITDEMLVGADAIDAVVERLHDRHPDRKIFFASAQQRELVNFFIQGTGQVVTFATGFGEEFIIGNLLVESMDDIVARPMLAKNALIRGWGWS
jgi:MoaA/NifB/PqqE/SkfB family radical SAM enzyme